MSKNLLKKSTKLEEYMFSNKTIWVKREDLSTLPPGPPFSKTRGLYEHIKALPQRHIGVLDTFHSYGGWAIAYICQALGKKAHVFYPQYVGDNGKSYRKSQTEAKKLGAELEPLRAGRSCILYHSAKTIMGNRFGKKGYMIPNALKIQESVDSTSDELILSLAKHRKLLKGTWIVSVSSGTIAAGVLKGLMLMDVGKKVTMVMHMGYSRSEKSLINYVDKMSGRLTYPHATPSIRVVDEGYQYKDSIDYPCPFPCNSYYDLKAYKWLVEHYGELKKPVLMWNIGAD